MYSVNFSSVGVYSIVIEVNCSSKFEISTGPSLISGTKGAGMALNSI